MLRGYLLIGSVLWADLEYHKQFNEGVDGSALVDTVLKLCADCLKVCSAGDSVADLTFLSVSSTSVSRRSCTALMHAHGAQNKFQLELEESWVLELDSSSPKKFSRHVIVRIPGAAFQNNFHVGAFVKDMCAAQEGMDPSNPVQQLLINKVDSHHLIP